MRQTADWYDVVNVLTDVAIGRTDQPLGSLVPSLGAWATLAIGDSATLECLGISPLSGRSHNALQRNHLDTWGAVGRVSPGHIGGFVNAGVKVVRDVTRLVIELGAAAEVGASPNGTSRPCRVTEYRSGSDDRSRRSLGHRTPDAKAHSVGPYSE